ncbi:MAG: NusG domain II-containing protein [Eubacteriales bacterium]
MKNKKIRNDIILVVSVIFIAAAAFLIFTLTKSEGAYAVVLKDGKETARYPLSEDIEVEIKTGKDSFNILKIENGKADMILASCPDGICVDHKPIKYNGETIVCLPNKLVIRIDSEDNGGVDAVS